MNKKFKTLNEVYSLNESVELSGNKLIVYHLTGSEKFLDYSQNVKFSKNRIKPKKPRKVKDRTQSILNTIEYKSALNYSKKPSKEEIELIGITDLLDDPFTKGTGFSPGAGAMYGPGLYTCYDFNPRIAHIYGNICLKFEVDISNYIIFFEDLAKQIHGEDWRIEDQVRKLFNNKFHALNNNMDIVRIKEDIITFSSALTDKIIGKSYNQQDLTSSAAFKFTSEISSKYTDSFLTSFFDGIIFRGDRDGPVCVIYNPQRKAEIIQIGRVTEDTVEVDWKNSLKEFFPTKNVLDIDFRTLNDISNENDTDEILFQEKQEEHLKELMPTYTLNNKINDNVEDLSRIEDILNDVLNDIEFNDKKINPVFINSVFTSFYSFKMNNLFNNNNKISFATKFQIANETNLTNCMDHLTLKSLELLTKIAFKINYFDDSINSRMYSLFVYALASSTNPDTNVLDYEKYSNIYLDNSNKIEADFILSLGQIYENTQKSFFSKQILKRFIEFNNNNITYAGSALVNIDSLNKHSVGLGMSEDEVCSLFEKFVSLSSKPDAKDYKLNLCNFAMFRDLISNREIQKLLSETINTLTSTMIIDNLKTGSAGILGILREGFKHPVPNFLVDSLINTLMSDFENLSTSNKAKIDNFFKNTTIDESLLSSINNISFINYYKQLRVNNDNWQYAISKLENCQSVLEIDNVFKNLPRDVINTKEFRKEFLLCVSNKNIIPHTRYILFITNIMNDETINFEQYKNILLSCLEKIDEKPNKKSELESIFKNVFNVSKKNTTDFLSLIEFIKSVPNKIFKSIEIGRVTYHEGYNILYEIISYDDQLLTQFFSNMDNLMITKIVKDLFDSVEYVITRHQTGYLPREGIIKFVNYLLNNKTLAPAVKTKVNTILDSVSQNSEHIADALIRAYINLIIH